ncbi:hypothetical protein GCM10020258_19940 [Sphingomonas yabuuchiae]
MEGSLGPLQEHARHTQRTRHFMADDDAPMAGATTALICALMSAGIFAATASHSRAARAGSIRTRALQIARAAQAGGEDEMPFEQRLGGTELGKDVFIGHGATPASVR